MLDELHIANVALIRDAWFEPSSAFTVITGETGTGKTALLNALKLVVGERAEAGMVREGEQELRVEGRFFLSHHFTNQSNQDNPDNEGILITRRVGTQGRSRVTIDGQMASVSELSCGVGASVDLCGQHEHQRLLKPSEQRVLLDAWGGEEIAEPKQAYQSAFAARQQARKYKEELQQQYAASSQELDQAKFVIAQIEKVDPQPHEYETLLEEMPRYEHAEILLRDLQQAKQLLNGMVDNQSGSDVAQGSSVLDALEVLSSTLGHMSTLDATFKSSLNQVQDAYYNLEDVSHVLASYADAIEFSPEELERRENRIAQLQGLMRTYGPRMEDVFTALEKAKEQVGLVEEKDELFARAQEKLDQTEEALSRAAEKLAQARRSVLPRFLKEINQQLALLDMGSASVEGKLEDEMPEQWNMWGSQSFELLFSPGTGLRAQKLSAIASGGEISRVMLAIKVVVGNHDEAETLVFDEIDAGVGGKAAVALADVLTALSKTHQIIVVTHLPQVAAQADTHYRVYKTDEAGLETRLELLDDSQREHELARMLSGTVTQTSLRHAQELLANSVR